MILALASLLVSQAAESPPSSREPPACWDGSQREMNACAFKEYQQADAAMNAQWLKTSELMKRLDTDSGPPNEIIGNMSHFEALLKGQRTWLAYREAYCSIFGASGGSSKTMLIYTCRRDETRARTEKLKSLRLNPMTGKSYYEDQ